MRTLEKLTPDVFSKYGAPMGRHGSDNGGVGYELSDGPIQLARIPLNNGGYDRGGAYWGRDQALWGYIIPTDGETGYLRARDREAAKAKIRESYPNARFYR